MIDDLRELNEQFYALYGRLYKNRELLGKAQEDSMAAKLLAQYEAEYELLHLREEIARAKELYELRLKRSALIPRTWRSWFFRRKYNRAAALSGERLYLRRRWNGILRVWKSHSARSQLRTGKRTNRRTHPTKRRKMPLKQRRRRLRAATREKSRKRTTSQRRRRSRTRTRSRGRAKLIYQKNPSARGRRRTAAGASGLPPHRRRTATTRRRGIRGWRMAVPHLSKNFFPPQAW